MAQLGVYISSEKSGRKAAMRFYLPPSVTVVYVCGASICSIYSICSWLCVYTRHVTRPVGGGERTLVEHDIVFAVLRRRFIITRREM